MTGLLKDTSSTGSEPHVKPAAHGHGAFPDRAEWGSASSPAWAADASGDACGGAPGRGARQHGQPRHEPQPQGLDQPEPDHGQGHGHRRMAGELDKPAPSLLDGFPGEQPGHGRASPARADGERGPASSQQPALDLVIRPGQGVDQHHQTSAAAVLMPARSQRVPNGAIIQHGTVLCATRLYSEGVRIFSVAQVGLTINRPPTGL